MMGTGKTVAGRVLASRSGAPFYDIDDEIEFDAGRSVAAIFSEDGEDRFRTHESTAVASIATRPPGVVATGGGSVLREQNVALMKESGAVILLRAAEALLVERLVGDSDRPLLADSDDPAEALAVLAEQRREAYLDAAEVIVDTDGRSPEEVAMAIEAACGDI